MLKILGFASIFAAIIGILIAANAKAEKISKVGFVILILGAVGIIAILIAGAVGIIPAY